MQAGLSVYNDSGVLQIDNQFNNIQFIDKTTVTLTNPWSNYYRNVYSRYIAAINMTPLAKSLLAFRCENGKFITWDETYPVRSYPPFVYGPPVIYIYGEPNAIVTIYRFTYANIPNGKHFEVKNANGELVFSDQGKFMKVLNSSSGTRSANFSSSAAGTVLGTTTHSSNKITAIASGNNCWQIDYDDWSHRGYVARLSYSFNPLSTVASYEGYLKTNSDNYHYDYRTYDLFYQYLVLDVTGL